MQTYFVIGGAEMLSLNCLCISSEQEKFIWDIAENVSHKLSLKKDARVHLIINIFFSFIFSRQDFWTIPN